MQTSPLPLVALAVLAAALSSPLAAAEAKLRVAAVQLRSTARLADNVAAIQRALAECAARRVQVAVFPECAVSSYFPAAILALSPAELAAAEAEIAAACRAHGVAAVVGVPERRDGRWYNCALVIDGSGRTVTRYDKAQLVGGDRSWQCVAGDEPPPVFTLAGVPATVNICHDSRYPELARLPVLAGARVIFYLSHESAIAKESKMGPYRAQVQARAVENNVFVVHANAPADTHDTGSHGQSRVVEPDGNVRQEASIFGEEILVAELDLAQATRERALPRVRVVP